MRKTRKVSRMSRRNKLYVRIFLPLYINGSLLDDRHMGETIMMVSLLLFFQESAGKKGVRLSRFS